MTTCNITIEINGSKCVVKSPYHPAFVRWAREHQGKWTDPYWSFDVRDESAVREYCRSLYGTDGSPVPSCDVRLELDFDHGLSTSDAYLFGRHLASRKERDWAVRLGEGVVVVSGGFPGSGGSVKHPSLKEKDGTVLEIRDVPVGLVRMFIEKTGPEGITIIREHDAEPETPIFLTTTITLDEICAAIA